MSILRFTIRDVLWLTGGGGDGLRLVLSLHRPLDGKAWYQDELRLCSEEIARLRAELAPVKPDKVYPKFGGG
jgi:hypothetical protein